MRQMCAVLRQRAGNPCRGRAGPCIVCVAMPGFTQRESKVQPRRIIVIVVPPVEELDLVGPLQVFGAANRLSGKPVYSVEVVTNGSDMNVAGEGGFLSFLARRRFVEVRGTFDSLLLVCGV